MRLFPMLLLACAACGAQSTLGEGDDDDSSPQPDASGQQVDIDAPSPDAAPSFLAQCMAKGYTAEAGLASLYRSVTTPAQFDAARAACAGDVPGATHLVVLSDDTEVAFIKTKLGWVGLSDQATEGTFENVTQEAPDKRPFLNGQPDNGSGTEDCAQMKAGGLDDDQCDSQHAYVCECDGRPDVP